MCRGRHVLRMSDFRRRVLKRCRKGSALRRGLERTRAMSPAFARFRTRTSRTAADDGFWCGRRTRYGKSRWRRSVRKVDRRTAVIPRPLRRPAPAAHTRCPSFAGSKETVQLRCAGVSFGCSSRRRSRSGDAPLVVDGVAAPRTHAAMAGRTISRSSTAACAAMSSSLELNRDKIARCSVLGVADEAGALKPPHIGAAVRDQLGTGRCRCAIEKIEGRTITSSHQLVVAHVTCSSPGGNYLPCFLKVAQCNGRVRRRVRPVCAGRGMCGQVLNRWRQ
jgi:hypothetical protein